MPLAIINLNRNRLLPPVFFLALSLAFCVPILKDLQLSLRGDWDNVCTLYETLGISLHEYGQFPLWNPYSSGGFPLIGNPHAGLISPLFLLTSLFGTFSGLKIAVWLHTFAGLWGMWLLGEHCNIRGFARLAPPAIFMFSGAWAMRLAEGHITWLPAAFLPLLMLCFFKAEKETRWIIPAATIFSLIFYEGGTYVLGFSLLFLAIYSCISSVEKSSARPLCLFFILCAAAAALSAPKLFPVMELLQGHPRPMGAGSAIAWDDLLFLFLERSTSLAGFGCWEREAYVGLAVLVLYLFSLSLWRQYKALVSASVFMLLIVTGNFSSWSPWNLVHSLPFFSGFQLPTRGVIVLIFSMALLVGLYLGKADAKDRKVAVAIALMVIFIAADLFTVSSPLLGEARVADHVTSLTENFTVTSVPSELYSIASVPTSGLCRSVPSVHQPFRQVRIGGLNRYRHGAWSAQYLPLLQNQGVVDAYETIPLASAVMAVGDPNYRGEYRLLEEGAITLASWSPNSLSFHCSLRHPDRLIINQNYWNGWRVTHGSLTNHEGLLAADLPAGEYTVTMKYLPASFLAGTACGFTTLAVMVCCWLRSSRKPIPSQASIASAKK